MSSQKTLYKVVILSDLKLFEKRMRQQLDAFQNPGKFRASAKPVGSAKTGIRIILAVRTKRLEMDTVFTHESSSISRIEAQMEAEKAARKAGYPIIGHVIAVESL